MNNSNAVLVCINKHIDRKLTELEKEYNKALAKERIIGSSVCVMQWTGVIRDVTLIEKGI